MNKDEFEAQMRAKEVFHTLRVPDDKWIVIRVDGKGFSKLTEKHFEKPYDIKFYDAMSLTATYLLQQFNAVYAYHESDEISILLRKDEQLFDREVEKLVSLSAAQASVKFSEASGLWAYFDSRVVVLDDDVDVTDYFGWRQQDSIRNCLNSYAYWLPIIHKHATKSQSSNALKKATVADKNAIIGKYLGIDFLDVPNWQRNGVSIYWNNIMKEGYNPKTQEHVTVPRRVPFYRTELPEGDVYKDFIRTLL